MDDQANVHPIACESCRNKKTKCDRDLPRCTQCISTRTNCQYPPVNKRGLPSGYITFIEQRLLETEIVVLDLLSAIYDGHQNSIPPTAPGDDKAIAELSAKQSKQEKLEEWRRFPLHTELERLKWFEYRRRLLHGQDVPAQELVSQDYSIQQAPLEANVSGQNYPTSDLSKPSDLEPFRGEIANHLEPRAVDPNNQIVPSMSSNDQALLDMEPLYDNTISNTSPSYIAPILEVGEQPEVHEGTVEAPHGLTNDRWRKYF
ncbi:hypothetical protein BU24DRAFT_440112 [Aaosphaeria arxii CBS 175.79]|uniref:Zn(2)-C6 fungal-type domain-containing protein n=1 Tax=Aaosphaeria arxii CBS 175.79 TaxID=1450172 RepID=A0A6A5XWD1_9PLEO|nr:uncharacterized protein BU24DRAFT_440112 [Aaosphaeria arxii CBS 175.79]KAF2016940.1 hypothetical protein BU24DRAFT_440112 [Aaosphaeria arxii CBS 175.79]